MNLKMTPKTRFLAALVLVGPEFENSDQFDSFFPKFMNKMSYSKMEYEALQSHFNFSQTEEYVKKMIDTEGIDFVCQFLIPTTEKVWYHSVCNTVYIS